MESRRGRVSFRLVVSGAVRGGTRTIYSVARGVLLSAAVGLSACSGPVIVRPQSDPTPPAIRLGTAGMSPDLLATSDRPTDSPIGRANRAAEVLLGATASDGESGIRNVSLIMSTTLTCTTNSPAANQLRTWSETISNPVADTSGAEFPIERTATHVLSVANLRAQCAAGRFYSLVVRAYGEAENSLGQRSATPEITVNHWGPDTLRVATLNHFQPGLARDDRSDVGQPVPGHPNLTKVDPWDALNGWGQRLYRNADIVFLTEVRNGAHVQHLSRSDVSGLRYYATLQDHEYTDVAILSRYPLSDVQPIQVGRNNILAATAMIENIPHLLIAAHWSIDAPENVSSASRRDAAQRMLDLIARANGPVFVGGDLNVLSGEGPEPPGTAPAEYIMLSGAVWDVYKLFLPRPAYCSDKRIDYIFKKGDYDPTNYDACMNPTPSDHPFVIVTFRPK